MKKERHFLCIDLKSFFASVECVNRGLNPFTTPLVVANKKQGSGAITLAVSPYLKKKGIKGRTRLYEIPKNISYIAVNPRMKLYLEKSKEVVSIYLDYVAKEDLHIYSIDECFLDVTDYLHLYKKNDYELALDILKTIQKKQDSLQLVELVLICFLLKSLWIWMLSIAQIVLANGQWKIFNQNCGLLLPYPKCGELENVWKYV